MLIFEFSYQIAGFDGISLPRYLGVDPYHQRFGGLNSNTNGLGRLSLSGIFATMILLIYDKEFCKKTKFIYTALILHTIMILLSQSRGTIIACVFGIIVFITTYFLQKHAGHSIIKKLIIVSVAVPILFLGIKTSSMVSSFVVSNFPTISTFQGMVSENKIPPIIDRDKQNTSEDDEDDITTGRLTLMKNGIKATLETNPLFGLSYGGNKIQIQNYIDSHNIKVKGAQYRGAGSMHNTIVQFFVNTGFLGLIGFLVFLLYFFRSVLVTTFTKQNTGDLKQLMIFNAMVGSLFVLNMVEWIFYFDYDNHFVNFFQMFLYGFYIRKYRKQYNEKRSM